MDAQSRGFPHLQRWRRTLGYLRVSFSPLSSESPTRDWEGDSSFTIHRLSFLSVELS